MKDYTVGLDAKFKLRYRDKYTVFGKKRNYRCCLCGKKSPYDTMMYYTLHLYDGIENHFFHPSCKIDIEKSEDPSKFGHAAVDHVLRMQESDAILRNNDMELIEKSNLIKQRIVDEIQERIENAH